MNISSQIMKVRQEHRIRCGDWGGSVLFLSKPAMRMLLGEFKQMGVTIRRFKKNVRAGKVWVAGMVVQDSYLSIYDICITDDSGRSTYADLEPSTTP